MTGHKVFVQCLHADPIQGRDGVDPDLLGDRLHFHDIPVHVAAKVGFSQDHHRSSAALQRNTGVAGDAVVIVVVVQGSDDEQVIDVRGHILGDAGLRLIRPLKQAGPFADRQDDGIPRPVVLEGDIVPDDRQLVRVLGIKTSFQFRGQFLLPELNDITVLAHLGDPAEFFFVQPLTGEPQGFVVGEPSCIGLDLCLILAGLEDRRFVEGAMDLRKAFMER